jgi:hypothetical protein
MAFESTREGFLCDVTVVKNEQHIRSRRKKIFKLFFPTGVEEFDRGNKKTIVL